MIFDLITLPLRIGACAARAGLQVAGALGAVATRLIEVALPPPAEVGGAAGGDATSESVRIDVFVARPAPIQESPSAPAPEAPGGAARLAPADAPPSTPAAPPSTPVTPAESARTVPETSPAHVLAAPAEADGTVPETSPAHVSEEPRFVEAFAEPGAEEGVGATVHVREPWKGYGRMTAKDIVARLTGASREELAAVELYERGHRSRRTVLAAADRGLRRATAVTASLSASSATP